MRCKTQVYAYLISISIILFKCYEVAKFFDFRNQLTIFVQKVKFFPNRKQMQILNYY